MEMARSSPTTVPYFPDQPKASNSSLTGILMSVSMTIETTNRLSASRAPVGGSTRNTSLSHTLLRWLEDLCSGASGAAGICP